VFVASSFALVSSSFTSKIASMPFTFVTSSSMRPFQPPDLGAEQCDAGDDRDCDSDDDEAETADGHLQPPC